MCVQTLHASARATDTSARPRALVSGGNERVAPGGVTGMSLGNGGRWERFFGRPDATLGLQSAHCVPEFRIGEPIAGGHRGPVGEERRVGDDRGLAVGGSDDDLEWPGGRTTELPGDDGEVILVAGRSVPRGRAGSIGGCFSLFG